MYKTIFEATENKEGYYISGKENIMNLFNNKYSQAEIVNICTKLDSLIEDFTVEKGKIHNEEYVQNIILQRSYDKEGNLKTKRSI